MSFTLLNKAEVDYEIRLEHTHMRLCQALGCAGDRRSF